MPRDVTLPDIFDGFDQARPIVVLRDLYARLGGHHHSDEPDCLFVAPNTMGVSLVYSALGEGTRHRAMTRHAFASRGFAPPKDKAIVICGAHLVTNRRTNTARKMARHIRAGGTGMVLAHDPIAPEKLWDVAMSVALGKKVFGRWTEYIERYFIVKHWQSHIEIVRVREERLDDLLALFEKIVDRRFAPTPSKHEVKL